MWVVKLGGSLARSRALPRWLEVLAGAGRGRAVVVPGGGPFADQVRTAQARWGFDDAAAHRMALLAMEQYGLMLGAMQTGLAPVATASEARRVLQQGGTALWMPTALALAQCKLPMSWDTTSDSLAAWFAKRLGASRLVLVKSVQLPQRALPAALLRRNGVIDAAFPQLLATGAFSTILLGPHDVSRLAALWEGADEAHVARAV